MTSAEPADERILVLTPTGRDAELTCDALAREGMAGERVADAAALAREAPRGAGAILVAEEALAPGGLTTLAAALDRQEPWSDVPIVVAASEGGSRAAHERIGRALVRAGSLTILERPIPTITLLTVLRSALSGRRRQYQRRDLIAELKANVQKLEDERALRDRFVAILAHDLRGPLATVKLSAGMLAKGSGSAARQHGLAERMVRNLEQMDRMIRDLLDSHRIEAGGGLPLHLAPCDLAQLARDTADELNATYGDRFVARADRTIEGIWSEDQLRRALWNLCTNALKYGDPGAPIELAVGRRRGLAYVSVHNRGPAISRQEQDLLFAPYGRARRAEAKSTRGWGLGLALVKGCAEAHGGFADVHSLPGEGTTFSIWLPPDARPHQPESPPAERPDPR